MNPIALPVRRASASRPLALGGGRGRFELRAAAAGESAATLYVYGDIYDNGGDDWYGWGIDVGGLVREIDQCAAPRLDVRINSRGGDVFAGIAIYNALLRCKAHVVTHNDAIAASIASVLLMAGAEVRMARGAWLMIHLAGTAVWGTAPELREMAQLLDGFDASLAEIYAAKTGKSVGDVLALMAAETWYSADQAVAEGFADEAEQAIAGVSAAGDLRVFARLPEPLRAVAAAQPPTPPERTMAENAPLAAITAEALRRDHPAVVAEIETAARAAERERITAILAVATDDAERAVVTPLLSDATADAGKAALAIIGAARQAGTAAGAKAAAFKAALVADENQLEAPAPNADAAPNTVQAQVSQILNAGKLPQPSAN